MVISCLNTLFIDFENSKVSWEVAVFRWMGGSKNGIWLWSSCFNRSRLYWLWINSNFNSRACSPFQMVILGHVIYPPPVRKTLIWQFNPIPTTTTNRCSTSSKSDDSYKMTHTKLSNWIMRIFPPICIKVVNSRTSIVSRPDTLTINLSNSGNFGKKCHLRVLIGWESSRLMKWIISRIMEK